MDLTPYDDLYANLLGSAIWALGGRLTSAAMSAYKKHGREPDMLLEAEFSPERRLSDLAATSAIRKDIGGEGLRAFFLSAELRDIAMGVGLSILAESQSLERTMKRRFLATFSWFAQRPEADLADDANRLFAAIAADVAAGLAPVVEADHAEARAAAIQALAADAESASTGVLRVLGGAQPPDFAAVEKFEDDYRNVLAGRLGRMEPPNHEGGTIWLDELYVEPLFRSPASDPQSSVSADQLRDTIHRTVVLGNPGAGKSSFARSVCYRLASSSESSVRVAPFLIELREYAVHEGRGLSIGDYITVLLRSSYQVGPPRGAVEYLLASGRAFVVFDGLDELTRASDRRRIRDNVEAFAQLHPFTPILVTSRVRGYHEVPLNDRRFETVFISDFDDPRVREYAHKWFELDRSYAQPRRKARAEAFLRESESVRDLRANPLMLALMCAIYKRQNHIPRNRAAVYQDCADMLFDRWDRQRDIEVDRPLDTHLSPLLQHIAHWIFEHQSLQAGVTHKSLVAHTSEYFRDEVTDDEQEARALAERFVSYCHGRGWVLVPTGSTELGEELYEFAHRTFLEYFAAAYFAAEGTDSQRLANILLPHVEVDEWEMVALLAVQIRNDAVRGSGTEIINAIAERARGATKDQRGHLLAFAARTYEFMVPRPAASNRIAAMTVEHHVRTQAVPDRISRMLREGAEEFRFFDNTAGALARLVEGDPDARRPVLDAFVGKLAELGTAANEDVRVVAFDCALNMNLCEPAVERGAWAQRVSDGVWPVVESVALSDARRHRFVGQLLELSRKLATTKMLDWHGVRWVFQDLLHPAFPNVHTIALSDAAVGALLASTTTSSYWDSRGLEARLGAIGEKLSAVPPPWVELAGWRRPHWNRRLVDDDTRSLAIRGDTVSDDLAAIGYLLIWIGYLSADPGTRKAVIADLRRRQGDFAASAAEMLATRHAPPIAPESTWARMLLSNIGREDLVRAPRERR